MPNAPFSCQSVNFVNTIKKTIEKQNSNFFRSALFHMKTRVSVKYFVNDCELRLGS